VDAQEHTSMAQTKSSKQNQGFGNIPHRLTGRSTDVYQVSRPVGRPIACTHQPESWVLKINCQSLHIGRPVGRPVSRPTSTRSVDRRQDTLIRQFYTKTPYLCIHTVKPHKIIENPDIAYDNDKSNNTWPLHVL
jgi:hypothetical protein